MYAAKQLRIHKLQLAEEEQWMGTKEVHMFRLPLLNLLDCISSLEWLQWMPDRILASCNNIFVHYYVAVTLKTRSNNNVTAEFMSSIFLCIYLFQGDVISRLFMAWKVELNLPWFDFVLVVTAKYCCKDF